MADKKEDIVLSIRDMSKSFGRNRVLDHINLDVKRDVYKRQQRSVGVLLYAIDRCGAGNQWAGDL